MPAKKILWKSDFRSFTALFGTITLFLLATVLIQIFDEHRPEEAIVSAIGGLIPLTLTLVFAFVDSDAIRRSMDPNGETEEARTIRRESCLNPENSDRAKAALTKDPPDIG